MDKKLAFFAFILRGPPKIFFSQFLVIFIKTILTKNYLANIFNLNKY
jgi:hypothetical protein